MSKCIELNNWGKNNQQVDIPIVIYELEWVVGILI